MTTYICQKCKARVSPSDLKSIPGVRCMNCNYRILLKERPPIIKTVKAK